MLCLFSFLLSVLMPKSFLSILFLSYVYLLGPEKEQLNGYKPHVRNSDFGVTACSHPDSEGGEPVFSQNRAFPEPPESRVPSPESRGNWIRANISRDDTEILAK